MTDEVAAEPPRPQADAVGDLSAPLVDRLPSQQSPIGQPQNAKAVAMAFEGPMPPPDLLRDYGDIQSDLPERIMCMAEKEQAHRHTLEQTALQADIAARNALIEQENRCGREAARERTLGQWMAYTLMAGGLGGGFYLIATAANNWVQTGLGVVFTGVGLATVATRFLSSNAHRESPPAAPTPSPPAKKKVTKRPPKS